MQTSLNLLDKKLVIMNKFLSAPPFSIDGKKIIILGIFIYLIILKYYTYLNYLKYQFHSNAY